jgi:NDP-sugar pyrophosphorylase family protein
MTGLQIVVLAAGKGTRMPDDVPKMLRTLAGEPMLRHVLRTARALDPERIVLVLGHRAAEVRAAFASEPVEIVLQTEQRGTGHAVLCARPFLAASGTLLVLYGDVPLLRPLTLASLLETHVVESCAATILSAEQEDPTGYGRVIRGDSGRCIGIVEQPDLRPGQERIREVNSGVMAFAAPRLFETLDQLRPDNDQNEYYLTDAIAILEAGGCRIGCHIMRDPDEMQGINTLAQLAAAERVLARRGPDECELCAAARRPPGQPLGLIVNERTRLDVSAHPFNSGHVVLYPNRHVTHLLSLTEEESREIGRTLRVAEDLLRRACRYEGLNVGVNSGAGEHLAFQVVPRWPGDVNYLPLVAGLRLVPEDPQETWRRLKEIL